MLVWDELYFTCNQVLDLDELVQEEEKKAPLICLLTTGSDPCNQVCVCLFVLALVCLFLCVCLLNNDLDRCNQIEGMARAAETEYRQISMGQVGLFLGLYQDENFLTKINTFLLKMKTF